MQANDIFIIRAITSNGKNRYKYITLNNITFSRNVALFKDAVNVAGPYSIFIIANIRDSISKLINENKKSEKDLKDSNEDLLNSQAIKINQDLIKNNETEKAQSIHELRGKRSEILNRPNDPELEQDFRRACSKFSSDVCVDQQAYQDYTHAYRQKTSLYTIIKKDNRTNLIIYDTENNSKEVRILETPETLDAGTCIAQLPNGNLFCFGNCQPSGVSLIIDENYRVRQLPSVNNPINMHVNPENSGISYPSIPYGVLLITNQSLKESCFP